MLFPLHLFLLIFCLDTILSLYSFGLIQKNQKIKPVIKLAKMISTSLKSKNSLPAAQTV